MQNSPPRADKFSRGIGIALALVYFVLCIIGTRTAPASWNDMSRIAAVEALVEQRTWAIDETFWGGQTKDKVLLNGKFYSEKMPLLSWFGAGVYAPLYASGIGSLAPDCATSGKVCGYYWVTLILIGLPASIMIWLFYRFAFRIGMSMWRATVATLTLGLATMVLPYSLVLNHHLPAAVCLFASFYLVHSARENVKYARLYLGAAGLVLSLAVMFEPASAIMALGLFVAAALWVRGNVVFILIGALPPLLVTLWLDYQIAQTVLPPYMIPGGYAYPGSEWADTIGGLGKPDDVPQYGFKMLFGAQGLYAYNPLLLFALAGLLLVALRTKHPLRIAAISLGTSFAVLTFYLVTQTGNLGGEAYGERFYVHTIPLLMMFLLFAPPLARVSAQNLWTWLTTPFFILALALSLFSTYQGARQPWRYVPPPTHPTRDSQSGALGWKWEVPLPWR